MNLIFDEHQLISIFNIGTWEGIIPVLEKMSTELEPDETDLREMTESAVEKLRSMTSKEYEMLDFMAHL